MECSIFVRFSQLMPRSSRIAIIVLSLVLLTAVAFLIYGYLLNKDLNRRLLGLQVVEEVNQPLEKELVHQQIQLTSLGNTIDSLRSELQGYQRYNDSAKGVFYEVQVGKFRHFSIAEYREQLINLRQGQEEELNVILLGRFTALEEAEELLKKVKKLGFSTAFVIGRIDGRICSVDEALTHVD